MTISNSKNAPSLHYSPACSNKTLKILETAESGPSWPVISVITVGESTVGVSTVQYACYRLFVLSLFLTISLIWALIEFFYTFNGMLVNVPVGAAAALLREAVWNSWLR